MKVPFLTIFLLCVLTQADEPNLIDSSQYFNCEFHTPRPCQIETEYGVKAFMESNFPHYPMIIHVNSDKTAFVFYDILRQPIEEISLLGLKQSQIENILDKRGFYSENPDQFKELEKFFDDLLIDLSN
ncbi:Selenoprotein F/M domain-containing protein [Entamoeba marina]